jgi:spermidine/putrescine transport system substrate-binding protein
MGRRALRSRPRIHRPLGLGHHRRDRQHQVYDGDPNTADIFLDPPEELQGKINVIPEMSDIMHLDPLSVGGEPCTGDMEILREVRDTLTAAKPHWIAMDYGTVDAYAAGDIAAGVYWNGASMRARLQNDDLVYGYPQAGFPVWMDNAGSSPTRRTPRRDAVHQLHPRARERRDDLQLRPLRQRRPPAPRSSWTRSCATAPEIVVPEDLVGAGRFSITCPAEVNDIYTQIWTELLQ